MSAVVFLLLVVVVAAVGSVVVYLRQRTPSSLESGIDDFRREMDALAVRQGNGTHRDQPGAAGPPPPAGPPSPAGPPGRVEGKG